MFKRAAEIKIAQIKQVPGKGLIHFRDGRFEKYRGYCVILNDIPQNLELSLIDLFLLSLCVGRQKEECKSQYDHRE